MMAHYSPTTVRRFVLTVMRLIDMNHETFIGSGAKSPVRGLLGFLQDSINTL
ncbi:Uncharacterised protein [Klebsiella pneumoniae]|nr:Uncharacterised protein [Klebsiella pneumoniae]